VNEFKATRRRPGKIYQRVAMNAGKNSFTIKPKHGKSIMIGNVQLIREGLLDNIV
jgi:hypothetical protein